MAVIQAKVIDTTHLELLKPIDLPEGAHVVVSLAPDDERTQWISASLGTLQAAYGEDEPEYSLEMLKTINPEFDDA